MAWVERYVTSSGAGAHDGTSEANAWSWEEMLSNQEGGQRANVKGDITTTAALQSWSRGTSGSASSPFGLRGYVSTIGDLDDSRTNDSGALSGSFPKITCPVTGSANGIELPEHNDFRYLEFECNANSGATIVAASGKNHGWLYGCKVVNSSTGRLVDVSARYKQFINCDFDNAGTGTINMISLNRGDIVGCRITNSGGSITEGQSAITLNGGLNSHVIGCQIFDYGTAVSIDSGVTSTVFGCAARNVRRFVYSNDTTNTANITGNIAWGDNGSFGEFYEGNSVNNVILAFNAYGNFSQANQNPGDYDEVGKVTLTADPFTSSSDLRLNDTAGGGAACRGAGIFGSNLGTIDPTSSGGGFISHRGMNGALIG